MRNYNEVVVLARKLVDQADAYDNRPTKAESARIRKTMNEIKKRITLAKSELIEADKA